MSIHERDYVLRMIRRMLDMLGRAMGLERSRPEEAKRTIDETGQTLFGPLYRTLRDADAQTAATLVSDLDKRWALAALLFEEGKQRQAAGAPKGAQRDYRTAVEILLDLAATPAGLTEDGRATLREVAALLDVTRLSEDRRAALGRALKE